MAKSRRSSTENIFGNKGTVRPMTKEYTEDNEEIGETSLPYVDDTTSEALAETDNSHTDEQKISSSDNSLPRKEHLDKLFTAKSGRGEQRTIYFKKNVIEYCVDISKRYGIGLSEVVNKLIESYINEE